MQNKTITKRNNSNSWGQSLFTGRASLVIPEPGAAWVGPDRIETAPAVQSTSTTPYRHMSASGGGIVSHTGPSDHFH